MRIRHPRSGIIGPRVDYGNASSIVNSEYTTISVNGSMMEHGRQVSPGNSYKSGDQASPRRMESPEDTNATYLKPAFLDPMITSKGDPVYPSPLALLAKTCQNIGQMMESSNRPIIVTQTATTLPRTSASVELNTSIVHPAQTHSFGTNKLNKPKVTTSINGTHPPDVRLSNCVKKNAPLARSKWNRTETTRIPTTTMAQPIGPSYKVEKLLNGCATDNSIRIHSTTVKPPTQVSIATSVSASINSNMANQSNSKGLRHNPGTAPPIDPNEIPYETTSNSLAQLVRLSSSLSLPEAPRSVSAQVDNAGSRDKRSHPDDSQRTSHHFGGKRLRHTSGSDSHTPTPTARRAVKEVRSKSNRYADQMNQRQQQQPGSPSIAPETTTCSNGFSAGESNHWKDSSQTWMTSLMHVLQYMMEQKQESAHLPNSEPPPQDTSSYQTIRSFLDFFYNGQPPQSHPPQFHGSPELPTATIPSSAYGEFKNAQTSSPSSSSSSPESFRFLPSTIQPLPSKESQFPTQFPHLREETRGTHGNNPTSNNTNHCILCGYPCANQMELCMHLYAHFQASSERDQASGENLQLTREGIPVQMGQQQQQQHLKSLRPHEAVHCDTMAECGNNNSTFATNMFQSDLFTPNPQHPTAPPPPTSAATASNIFQWMSAWKNLTTASTSPPPPLASTTTTMAAAYPSVLSDMNAPRICDVANPRPSSHVYDPDAEKLRNYWSKMLLSFGSTNPEGLSTTRLGMPGQAIGPSDPTSSSAAWPSWMWSSLIPSTAQMTLFPKV